MGRPKKEVKKAEEAAPVVDNSVLDKRKAELVTEIQKGMPSVSEMKTQPFGLLRKQKAWEKRSKPFIAELEKIEGRPTSVERFRPGR